MCEELGNETLKCEAVQHEEELDSEGMPCKKELECLAKWENMLLEQTGAAHATEGFAFEHWSPWIAAANWATIHPGVDCQGCFCKLNVFWALGVFTRLAG